MPERSETMKRRKVESLNPEDEILDAAVEDIGPRSIGMSTSTGRL